MSDGRGWEGWRWWVKLGIVTLASFAACGLIVFGAVRFLDQAQRQHDQVECIRAELQSQVKGNASMASAVLNPAVSQTDKVLALENWRDQQADSADRVERC